MNIVVLYEELAWYFVNCLNVLAKNNPCKITVFCRKSNANAPFEFNYVHPNIRIEDRSKFTVDGLLKEIKSSRTDVIFLCGWVYKPYLTAIKKSGIKNCILGIDNQWTGSFKQIIGSFYFRLALKPFIKSVFVPGKLQYMFARKLGFSKKNILPGAYCCDYGLFHKNFEENKLQKKQAFPKRFLFVGRYVKEKGITDLWEAFAEVEKEVPGWELWCLGIGDIAPVQHPKIKHFGFKQAHELGEIIKNTGVFVLPSLFEPWGVVVHEYTAAGFPVICSDKVGAIDAFLVEGKNGFVFPAGDKEALKEKLRNFIKMSPEELNLMSENSSNLASTITPETWAGNFIKLSQNG